MRGTSDFRRAIRLDRRGHCAVLGSLALALWLVQASWCPSLARADLIGINFKGPTQAGTGASVGDQTAGVEPQTYWNDVGWWLPADLLDKTGATTAVSVTTTTDKDAYNSYVNVDPPDGGNDYLMRGYIYTSGDPLKVIIADLEPPFTTDNYDIIVYFDGENESADWVTQYTIDVDGTTTIATVYGRDAKDTVPWDGTFVQSFGTSAGDATAGNYVRFAGLTAGSFTLTATPVAGSGPINAIQIIAAPEPASASLLALGLATALAARVQRPKPGYSA